MRRFFTSSYERDGVDGTMCVAIPLLPLRADSSETRTRHIIRQPNRRPTTRLFRDRMKKKKTPPSTRSRLGIRTRLASDSDLAIHDVLLAKKKKNGYVRDPSHAHLARKGLPCDTSNRSTARGYRTFFFFFFFGSMMRTAGCDASRQDAHTLHLGDQLHRA